jgi:hypothetical protein
VSLASQSLPLIFLRLLHACKILLQRYGLSHKRLVGSSALLRHYYSMHEFRLFCLSAPRCRPRNLPQACQHVVFLCNSASLDLYLVLLRIAGSATVGSVAHDSDISEAPRAPYYHQRWRSAVGWVVWGRSDDGRPPMTGITFEVTNRVRKSLASSVRAAQLITDKTVGGAKAQPGPLKYILI